MVRRSKNTTPTWMKTRQFNCGNPECKKLVVLHSHRLGGGGSYVRNKAFKSDKKYCSPECRWRATQLNSVARYKTIAKAEA